MSGDDLEKIPLSLIEKIIEQARNNPSDYNLQPTVFTIIQDTSVKQRVYKAALYAECISHSSSIIALSCSRRDIFKRFDEILQNELQEGVTTPEASESLRTKILFDFEQGPFFAGWFIKGFLRPIIRLFTPLPLFPAFYKRYWLTKQAGLSAMSLVNAVKDQGFSCTLIHSFDEGRIRNALGLPYDHIIPYLVVLNSTKDIPITRVLLPKNDVIRIV